jgi:hypothetical protein
MFIGLGLSKPLVSGIFGGLAILLTAVVLALELITAGNYLNGWQSL